MHASNPLKLYQQTLTERGITPDATQLQVLEALATIHKKLTDTHIKLTHKKIKHHMNKVFGLKQHPVKGLYLWGGVGRGKTLLMDVFFEHLPFRAKQRLHFHRFMRHVHHEMKRLEGMKNPLRAIAKETAKQTHILCFDEFYVDDVADAMILGNLLDQLFHEGVTIIFTSNTEPSELYKKGVQRQLFVPAIKLIQKFTDVIHVDAGQDYRIQTLLNHGVYFTPLNDANREAIKSEFLKLATGKVEYGNTVSALGREIPKVASAHDLVWFDFKDICVSARSAQDYLALTEQFDTFIVTGVPVLRAEDDAAARRFIHIVDVLYDHHDTLIINAETSPDKIYQGQSLQKDFQRTQSRLIEMQSESYLR